MKGVLQTEKGPKSNLIDFKVDHFSDQTPQDPDDDAVELSKSKVRREDSEVILKHNTVA